MRKLIFFIAVGTLLLVYLYFPKKETPVIKSADSSQSTYAPDITPQYTQADFELLILTNRDRIANNLPTLSMDERLDKSSMLKCNDMLVNNYWDHVSPKGVTPWYWFGTAGIISSNMGENLAKDFSSLSLAETGLMNSPTHRANILGDYSMVGFAQCGTIVVEHFAK